MLAFDRETMMIVGLIVCLGVVVYMYRDMQKTKEDVYAVKTFSLNLMKNLTIEQVEPTPAPAPAPVAEEKKEE